MWFSRVFPGEEQWRRRRRAVAARSHTIPAPSEQKAGTWSETATRVLRERYLLRDATGAIVETPDEMCWRVASAVAMAETQWTKDRAAVAKTAQRFYDMMVEHRFLPNSPTLMNAGKGNNLQLSACYVVPVEDSLEGIFEAVKHAALIHQSGGGTGFSFSRLRPKGSIVGSTHGVASGPVSFMKIFDGATEAVKQGGTRRGANMGVLRVDHPDIEEFIDCKRDGSVTNFNISVGVTEVFMQALESDAEYELVNPHDGTDRRNTPRPRDHGEDRGRRLGDRRSRTALPRPRQPQHSQPHPRNRDGSKQPTHVESSGLVHTTPATSARSTLASSSANEYGKATDVDWTALEEATRLTRALPRRRDRHQPLSARRGAREGARRTAASASASWAGRRCSSSWALRYDSDEAIALGERVMTSIRDWSRDGLGEHCAEVRGAFPNWSRSIYKDGEPLRNSTRTTVAPTGSISILADCSSGIEPIFALAFQHRVKQPDGSLPRARLRQPVLRARADGERHRGQGRRAGLRQGAWLAARARRRGASGAAAVCHRARDRARLAHPHAGGLPAGRRQLDQQDDQSAQQRDTTRTCCRPTCWRGTWAASASPSSATAARASRCSTSA